MSSSAVISLAITNEEKLLKQIIILQEQKPIYTKTLLNELTKTYLSPIELRFGLIIDFCSECEDLRLFTPQVSSNDDVYRCVLCWSSKHK